ncbi:MAG: N-acetyltransferase [Bacteroides sp.]|nr:N-acetyltransferase [Bacteroides sp.]
MPYYIEQIRCNKERYPELLLIAAPSEERVRSCLSAGDLYVTKKGEEVVCAALMKTEGDPVELKNLVAHPSHLRQGHVTRTMKYLMERYGNRRICSGTGGTGIESVEFFQLTFYRKMGFQVTEVIRNYFTDTYPEPIYEENGM